MRVNDVTKIYRVSRRTIYNWMDSGKVEWGQGPSGKRYVYVDSLHLMADLKMSRPSTLEYERLKMVVERMIKVLHAGAMPDNVRQVCNELEDLIK